MENNSFLEQCMYMESMRSESCRVHVVVKNLGTAAIVIIILADQICTYIVNRWYYSAYDVAQLFYGLR